MSGPRGPLAAVSVALALAALAGTSRAAAPQAGLTAVARVAEAYDAILNAEDDRLSDLLARTCPPAPTETCRLLDALALWWRISRDPDDRALDARFVARADEAVSSAEAWTAREPERAEAFFYLGAAYGNRAQWQALRGERLAAAREAVKGKTALERALLLDPGLADAAFGIGMYRYYAAVASAGARMLRWLLMMPGGDRIGGLAQMRRAQEEGALVRGEAAWQLHLAYLWYEGRHEEALALVEQLARRYPRSPLFPQAAAEITFTYFHDPSSARRRADALIASASRGAVGGGAVAELRARLFLAEMLDELHETDRALAELARVTAQAPGVSTASASRAAVLTARMTRRLARESYRIGLEGWRAFEDGDLARARSQLSRSVALDPRDPVTHVRLARVLRTLDDVEGSERELRAALALRAPRAAPMIAEAHAALAALLLARGDRAGALAHYDEASRVFGADPRTRDAAATEAARLRAQPERR